MPALVTTPLWLALAFLALFSVSELLYHVMKIKAEVTRKIVHTGTGLLTLLFPLLLTNVWQVLFLCGSFLILLLASLQWKWLPSINAIDRISHGSILYPVAVFFCYLVFLEMDKGFIFFYLPILILAVCDPLAALIGKRFPYGRYQIGKASKTWAGSLSFFAVAWLIAILLLCFVPKSPNSLPTNISKSAAIAMVATASEAIGGDGLDNLMIPVGVILCLMWLL